MGAIQWEAIRQSRKRCNGKRSGNHMVKETDDKNVLWPYC